MREKMSIAQSVVNSNSYYQIAIRNYNKFHAAYCSMDLPFQLT